MKDIVDFLKDKKLFFKKLEKIDIKLLKSRKKIDIFSGVDTNSNYVAIFRVHQKSRFVTKSAQDAELLLERLILLKNHNYKIKIIFINASLCSKAKEFLKKRGWRVFHATL